MERTKPRETTTYIPALPVPTNAKTLKWGIVSTIKAPLIQVARFAAWHLEAGAAHLHIHLDLPDHALAKRLAHPKITFTQCDDAYWEKAPVKAKETHQMRQAYNASKSYSRSTMDWLAHIDVDEFLLSKTPLSKLLAAAKPDAAFVHLDAAEMMASQDDPWNGTTNFKRTHRYAQQPKSVLSDIYPTFGPYISGGFLSYTGGKNIARTGLPKIRLGIHSMIYRGLKLSNGQAMPEIAIGHAHTPNWEVFKAHFDFRISKGSYQKGKLHNVLSLVLEEGGEAGLRRFFDEVCTATPQRLDLLAAHGMLLKWNLDLDKKVLHHFGPMEEQQ